MVITPHRSRTDYVTERRRTTCDGCQTPALTGVPVGARRSLEKSALPSGGPVDPTRVKHERNGRVPQ
eukprot:10717868-Heterocapsa_arctica.AAC.1